MLSPCEPALILAPMEGVTDAPMRALMGESGVFTFAVSEFLRVSQIVLPKSAFRRHVPELLNESRTPCGLPVQVQLLGGHAGRLAESAARAVEAGAIGIDLNFGCPARTVNRHDGGATLLQYPKRIREIVMAVRAAVPRERPVSAKMRLGWDSIDAIDENAEMAAEGGASWLTIHGRTRFAGYAPPIFWGPIGRVRERLKIPVVANGDIWSIADFSRCREITGCRHFMLGRGALANPDLPRRVAIELGLTSASAEREQVWQTDWHSLISRLAELTRDITPDAAISGERRYKQWLKLAATHGSFAHFDLVKQTKTAEELIGILKSLDFEQATTMTPSTSR